MTVRLLLLGHPFLTHKKVAEAIPSYSVHPLSRRCRAPMTHPRRYQPDDGRSSASFGVGVIGKRRRLTTLRLVGDAHFLALSSCDQLDAVLMDDAATTDTGPLPGKNLTV